MITQIAACVCDNDNTWLYQPRCITIAPRPNKGATSASSIRRNEVDPIQAGKQEAGGISGGGDDSSGEGIGLN